MPFGHRYPSAGLSRSLHLLQCKSSLEESAANKPFCITLPNRSPTWEQLDFFSHKTHPRGVQVRLADGSRVVVKLNTFHTVWFSSHVLSNFVFQFLLLKFKKEILKHWVGCPMSNVHPSRTIFYLSIWSFKIHYPTSAVHAMKDRIFPELVFRFLLRICSLIDWAWATKKIDSLFLVQVAHIRQEVRSRQPQVKRSLKTWKLGNLSENSSMW